MPLVSCDVPRRVTRRSRSSFGSRPEIGPEAWRHALPPRRCARQISLAPYLSDASDLPVLSSLFIAFACSSTTTDRRPHEIGSTIKIALCAVIPCPNLIPSKQGAKTMASVGHDPNHG